VKDAGHSGVTLFGGAPLAARTSTAFREGEAIPADLTLVFERARSRSMLAALPEVLERAALWHPGWVHAWTFWMLIVLVAVGLTLLLWRAIVTAQRVPGGSYDSRP
jgi:hypothetical protein